MKPLPTGPEDAAWLARAAKKTALFSGLELSMIERALARFRLYAADSGEKIIKEGTGETALYFLYTGGVRVSRAKLLFLRQSMGELKPGDFFGEMALLVNGSTRTATVTAAEPSKVFALAGGDFQELLRSNPEFRNHMTRVANERKAKTAG